MQRELPKDARRLIELVRDWPLCRTRAGKRMPLRWLSGLPMWLWLQPRGSVLLGSASSKARVRHWRPSLAKRFQDGRTMGC